MCPAPVSHDPAELFADLADAHLGEPGVTREPAWHNDGLKVHGKISAMLVRGNLVVKIPAAQAEALKQAHRADAFEPRPGRPMKEWVVVPPSAGRTTWRRLIDDACAYVGAAHRGG